MEKERDVAVRRRNEEIAGHQMHKKNCFTVENAGMACLWQ